MPIELNHTIVHARRKQNGAAFLARILDVPVGDQLDPVPVRVSGVTLDYMDDQDDFTPRHSAFLVADRDFDAALARLTDGRIRIWADSP